MGPTGSGKSALSNGIIDNEDLEFEIVYGLGVYFPKQKNTFEISCDLNQSMTSDP